MVLDTEATRLDVSSIVAAAVRAPRPTVLSGGFRIDVDGSMLTIEGRQRVVLSEYETYLPSGRRVLGPALAWCPERCGRRVRTLWAVAGARTFACRTCAGIAYASASTSSTAERTALAYHRLRARLGDDRAEHRRPHEHEDTHRARLQQLERARERVEAAVVSEAVRARSMTTMIRLRGIVQAVRAASTR